MKQYTKMMSAMAMLFWFASSALSPASAAALLGPGDRTIPDNEQGKIIRQGQRLLSDTRRLLPQYVGAEMNCTSCHLSQGKLAFSSPFVGLSQKYPSYNPRAGRDVTLTERINGCMLRSMNGKKLAPDSAEMRAMLAYINWLSADYPAGKKVEGAGIGTINKNLKPDSVHGKLVYQRACAVCHGDEGQGLQRKGEMVFPPLWGEHSFNIGAGMARTYTAAAWVKQNMPLAAGLNAPLGQGKVLTDQEALDVAEYFTHQPRPDFPGKENDWPKGGKPADARY